MLPATPSPASIQKQFAKLQMIGLTATDIAAMRGLVARFSAQYATWKSQVRASNLASQGVATFEAAMDAIVQQTRDLVAQQLGPEGAAKFVSYVQSAKQRMLVRP